MRVIPSCPNRLSLPLVVPLVLVLLIAAAPAALAAEGPERQILVPEGWEGAYEFGYAPVVRVGDQVIVSGVPAGGPGTYEDKVRRMYQRAGELLAVAGAGFDDVVEVNTFHAASQDTAAFRQEFGQYMPIHKEFFGDHRPAWTAIGNAVLLANEAPVEMRLLAVVGSGENSRVVRGAGAEEAGAEEAGAEQDAEAADEKDEKEQPKP